MEIASIWMTVSVTNEILVPGPLCFIAKRHIKLLVTGNLNQLLRQEADVFLIGISNTTEVSNYKTVIGLRQAH